jgi:hypothetical protein
LGTAGTSAGRPLVWGLLTCAIAAVTAFMGYSVGGSSGGETTRAAASPVPKAAPALIRIPDLYSRGRADGYRLAEDRAFVRGRREGLAEGRRAAARKRDANKLPFPGRGWYAVGVREDGKTPATPPMPLASGRSYSLCKGGAALCESVAKRAPGR